MMWDNQGGEGGMVRRMGYVVQVEGLAFERERTLSTITGKRRKCAQMKIC